MFLTEETHEREHEKCTSTFKQHTLCKHLADNKWRISADDYSGAPDSTDGLLCLLKMIVSQSATIQLVPDPMIPTIDNETGPFSDSVFPTALSRELLLAAVE